MGHCRELVRVLLLSIPSKVPGELDGSVNLMLNKLWS